MGIYNFLPQEMAGEIVAKVPSNYVGTLFKLEINGSYYGQSIAIQENGKTTVTFSVPAVYGTNGAINCEVKSVDGLYKTGVHSQRV